MNTLARNLGKGLVGGVVLGLAAAVLVVFMSFRPPEALITVVLFAAWWSVSKKLEAIREKTEYLHTATNGLILPRLARVEKRQRGRAVPEPQDGRDYDDWEMFCAEEPTPGSR